MKITGVLLGTVQEQIDGGQQKPRIVDPRRVKDATRVPVEIDFDFDFDKGIGWADVAHDEDGRLVFQAGVPDPIPSFEERSRGSLNLFPRAPAPTYREELWEAARKTHLLAAYGGTAAECWSVGLVAKNANRNQPTWEIVEEVINVPG